MYFIGASSTDRDDCERLTKNFEINKLLGKGAYGQVYELCKNGNCKYALKVIVYDQESYENCGRCDNKSLEYIQNTWEREVNNMKALNECQDAANYKFTPELYDSWLCTEETKTTFYILMEKFEGNLQDFINKYLGVSAIKVAAVAKLEVLELQLRYIHYTCKICLNDIKLENILYNQVDTYAYEFVFADLGKSTLETDPVCIEQDSKNFQRRIKEYTKSL